MSELEEKLGSILSNPQLMQQIAALAQTVGQPTAEQAPPEPEPAMLQSIAGILQKGNVDSQQQALLRALSPYLSQRRIDKLERAMRAAKMAGFASAFFKSGGVHPFGGR